MYVTSAVCVRVSVRVCVWVWNDVFLKLPNLRKQSVYGNVAQVYVKEETQEP